MLHAERYRSHEQPPPLKADSSPAGIDPITIIHQTGTVPLDHAALTSRGTKRKTQLHGRASVHGHGAMGRRINT